VGVHIIKNIGVVFPFDFLHLYGGASQSIKANLAALSMIGCSVKIIFPTKSSKAVLAQRGQALNAILSTYRNFQRISLLPEKLRLMLDEYSQFLNPFCYSAARQQFRKVDLLFAHFPLSFLASYYLKSRKIPILFVAHNFEYGLIKQTTRNPLARLLTYASEKFACSKALLVLSVSDKVKISFRDNPFTHINPRTYLLRP
jgi:hypothetical protein